MIEANTVNINTKFKGSKLIVHSITHHAFQLDDSDNKYDILLDTGASIHIIHNSNLFSKFNTNNTSESSYLEMADGTKSGNLIEGRGTVLIPICDITGTKCNLKLTDALYVPSFRRNIVSINLAVKAGYNFNFNDIGKETMLSPSGNMFKIVTKGSLYFLNNLSINSVISRTVHEWHCLLGHPNYEEVLKLPEVTKNMKITDKKKPPNCDICIKAKMCKTISKTPDERGIKCFDKVHIDLNGPINKENIIGGKYLFGAVCDFSNFINIFIMQNKSESAYVLLFYLSQIKPYGKPSIIRSDGGGEFISKEFNSILINKSIKHEYSTPYNPNQMGHIERQWRILFNCTRALMFESNIPSSLWPFAIKYATFLRNRTYNERIGCTPLEKATGKKPDVSKIKLFGSKCYVYDQFSSKLEPKALEGVFLGYDEKSPSMLILDPNTHEIRKSVNVKLLNTHFYKSIPKENTDFLNVNDKQIPVVQNEIICDKTISDTNIGDNNRPNHYLLRGRKNINYQENFCNLETDDSTCNTVDTSLLPFNNYNPLDNTTDDYFIGDKHFSTYSKVNHTSIIVPNTVKQVMQSKQKIEWIQAMDREMESLISNHTWDLVKVPTNKDKIGSRWVFTVKVDPSYNIKFKARFVVQGYSQIPGINFLDTYAPTPTMTSIRILMNIAAQESLLCHHCDVNNAYLNADIDFDDVYVKQPEGYTTDPTLYCKLNKALYGLKQAAYRWHKTIVEFMTTQGLQQSIMDPCVYVRRTKSSTLIILIWVDDLIIAASDLNTLNKFKTNFGNSFLTKDLGTLKWFLGINFNINDKFISLDQSFYVQTILNRFNMNEAKPRSLPCDPSVYDLLRQQSEYLENPRPYRELIGSLIYLMTATRPDLAFTVTLLSRFMQKPTKMQYTIGLGVLQYLKGTKHYDLKYSKSKESLRIVGHSDSDWASDIDFQSISGYVFKLNKYSAVISWRSGKQSLVAASSCEAEYISLFHAASEGIFLRQLLAELQKLPPQTVLIYGDNIGSITLAKHKSLSPQISTHMH